LFNFSKVTNSETRKKFFKKFNDIKFEDGLYKFEFNYKDFDVYKKYLNNKTFSVDSYGVRIKRFKNDSGYWDSKEICLTEEFNKLFSDFDVSNHNIKDIILNDEKICSKAFDIFKLMVQLRNTDNNIDYLVSPVKNKQNCYYDTRKLYYGYCCEDEQSKIECNPDMEASYNIAIKAMLSVYHNKNKNEDYFEYYYSR
jgi:CRISPR-associated protein Cpf1